MHTACTVYNKHTRNTACTSGDGDSNNDDHDSGVRGHEEGGMTDNQGRSRQHILPHSSFICSYDDDDVDGDDGDYDDDDDDDDD